MQPTLWSTEIVFKTSLRKLQRQPVDIGEENAIGSPQVINVWKLDNLTVARK